MTFVTGGPACQSCGSPMPVAKEHGAGDEKNPYCRVCTDRAGKLLPFAEVKQRMAEERFMKVNKMPKRGAEENAERALRAMPLWKDHA